MGNSKSRISCAEAREIDMVDYLAGLGFQPAKIRGGNFWYHSPFRNERTPSFKINRKLNRWYDFGEGSGGNLIDFAIRYKNWTVGEFLQSLSGNPNPIPKRPAVERPDASAETIPIVGDHTLSSHALIEYLNLRRIPIRIADRYCREVNYKVRGKTYYAIGFRNDAGGWELRNPYFKGSISPKYYSLIKNGKQTLCVFEGFMDFLTFLTLIPDAGDLYDHLTLNSLAFFEAAKSAMESYKEIWLFLDRDTAGMDVAAYAQSLGSKYNDKSNLYQGYKDLNDYLTR